MKSIIIFLLFFIIGVFAVLGYVYWNHQGAILNFSKPTITTKFSLANAPTDSLKGDIATMSGTVTWLSRVAKSPVKLKSPRSIQQGEELGAGKNSNVAVVIQNAEAIILSSNSLVNFIQMLPVNLVLEQNSGIVTYQNTGQSAMSVHSLDLITAVNRGSAEISMDQKTNTVTVTVEKGLVTEGYEDSSGNSNVVNVNEGQQFIFDDTALTGTVEGNETTTDEKF
jgi:hypothetical protein